MSGKEHVAIGCAALPFALEIAANAGYSERELVIIAGGIIVGSLIPDIDHPTSFLGKRLKLLSKIINKYFGGLRGITHDFLWVIVSLFVVLFTKTPYVGFFVGVSLHIVSDSMTVMGIPFLYFLNKENKYRILPKFLCCKSGSFMNLLVTGLICYGLIKLGVIYKWKNT